MSDRNVWDKLGIALSIVCLVHCIAVPLLLATGTLFALAGDAHGAFHQWIFWAIVPVAVLAAVPGWRRHGRRGVLVGMAIGAGLISSGAFAEDVLPQNAETLLTICGGVMLVASHFINLRLCRACPVCRRED